jgi:hypothetical protein
MGRNIKLNRFIGNYKNKAKYELYVKGIKKELYRKVLEREVDVWSQERQSEEVFNTIVDEYMAYVTDWIDRKTKNGVDGTDGMVLHNYLYKQFLLLKSLGNEIKVEESEFFNKLLGNKDLMKFGDKIGGLMFSNYDGFWNTFASEVAKDPSLRKKYSFSDLESIYPIPEDAALILNTAVVRTLNIYFLFEMESLGVINIDQRVFDINRDDFFVRLTPKKALKFKRRFTLDYKTMLGNLYAKLTSGPIKFINDELTKLDDFVEVFTCDNLNLLDKEIYFNVDRYQTAYILTYKLGFFFKPGFENIIVESQKFLKKPFGDERPLPIVQRDFSDYNSKYDGGTKKNSVRPLKNAKIINAIFSEIR